MKTLVYTNMDTHRDVIEQTVVDKTSRLFSRFFPKEEEGIVKFWIDRTAFREQEGQYAVSCGISLVRPDKRDIFVKKKATAWKMAMKDAFDTLQRQLSKEHHKSFYLNR